jgi:hypothetical protein
MGRRAIDGGEDARELKKRAFRPKSNRARLSDHFRAAGAGDTATSRINARHADRSPFRDNSGMFPIRFGYAISQKRD